MSAFDYISGDEFRNSLDNDYEEMKISFQNKSWKSTHIIAGSIIEAILLDSLISIKYTEKDPLKMSLNEIILACSKENIISQKIVELSNVIKNYRNLIHPGRSLRLQEKIDEHSANICLSLVELINNEVSDNRQKTYGYTAEQIVSKIENDNSAIFIIDHLLDSTNEKEIEKLLLQVIPNRYITYLEQEFDDPDSSIIMEHFETCFKKTFEISSRKIKEKISKHFVKILKEDSGKMVNVHENAFFKIEYLEYLNEPDRSLIKSHIFARLNKYKYSIDAVKILSGIGSYLKNIDELNSFFKPLINNLTPKTQNDLQDISFETLYSEYFYIKDEELSKKFREKIDNVIEINKSKPHLKSAIEKIKELKAIIEIPLDDK